MALFSAPETFDGFPHEAIPEAPWNFNHIGSGSIIPPSSAFSSDLKCLSATDPHLPPNYWSVLSMPLSAGVLEDSKHFTGMSNLPAKQVSAPVNSNVIDTEKKIADNEDVSSGLTLQDNASIRTISEEDEINEKEEEWLQEIRLGLEWESAQANPKEEKKKEEEVPFYSSKRAMVEFGTAGVANDNFATLDFAAIVFSSPGATHNDFCCKHCGYPGTAKVERVPETPKSASSASSGSLRTPMSGTSKPRKHMSMEETISTLWDLSFLDDALWDGVPDDHTKNELGEMFQPQVSSWSQLEYPTLHTNRELKDLDANFNGSLSDEQTPQNHVPVINSEVIDWEAEFSPLRVKSTPTGTSTSKKTTAGGFGGKKAQGKRGGADICFDENAFSDMFEYLTENLAEECRRKLFDDMMWKSTDFLLKRVEDDTGFTAVATSNPLRFMKEKPDSFLSTKFNGQCENISNVSNMQIVETARSNYYKATVQHFERSTPTTSPFHDLSGELMHIDEDIDSIYAKEAELHLLRMAVDSHKQIFSHMIRSVVLPCGDKVRKLVREMLCMRTAAGQLVIEISRVNCELSAIKAAIQDKQVVQGAYLQNRLKRCQCSLSIAETKFRKAQADVALLSNGFKLSIDGIVGTIRKIRATRGRLLKKYHEFYTSNDLQDPFFQQDVHQWTHSEEYKEMTMWHSDLDVDGFKTLLVHNIETLEVASESIATMLDLVNESSSCVERAISAHQ